MQVWLAIELPDEVVEKLEKLVHSGEFPSISDAINYMLKLLLCGPKDDWCWRSRVN